MATTVTPIYKRTHHWHDISLRDVLVAQVKHRRKLIAWIIAFVAAVFFGVWWIYVRPYQVQQSVATVLGDAGAIVETREGGPPWVALLFGDKIHDVIRVDLGYREPSDVLLDQIIRLPRLEVLVLGGPDFNSRKLRRLKPLKTLKVLVLDSAGVSDISVAAMQWRLPNTTIRRSQRRAINALQRKRVQIDTRLRGTRWQWQTVGTRHFEDAIWVLAQDTAITDSDLVHLKHLSELTWLSLARTTVTDRGLVYVARLKMLQEVDLEGTAVTDEGLKYLAQLPRLRQLWLIDSKVTIAGVQKLKKLRPELRVSI